MCLGIAVVFGIMRVPSDLSYIFHKRSGHTRSDRLAIGASQVVESGVTFFVEVETATPPAVEESAM